MQESIKVPPTHSIIIPHRDRARALWWTLWSIHRSELLCGYKDYEVVVASAGPATAPDSIAPKVSVVEDVHHPGIFNKPRLLNMGVMKAQGKILTFLDADMLVGRDWLAQAPYWLLERAFPNRVCYRVKQVRMSDRDEECPNVLYEMLERASEAGRDRLVDGWFSWWHKWTRAAEAYGRPEWTNSPSVDSPVFGNSQWSIRRADLEGLCFDEQYAGAGYEDIDMIDQIWCKFGERYDAVICTEANGSLLHVYHPRVTRQGDPWCDPKQNKRNAARYERMVNRRRRKVGLPPTKSPVKS